MIAAAGMLMLVGMAAWAQTAPAGTFWQLLWSDECCATTHEESGAGNHAAGVEVPSAVVRLVVRALRGLARSRLSGACDERSPLRN